jgi:hypothetical protein
MRIARIGVGMSVHHAWSYVQHCFSICGAYASGNQAQQFTSHQRLTVRTIGTARVALRQAVQSNTSNAIGVDTSWSGFDDVHGVPFVGCGSDTPIMHPVYTGVNMGHNKKWRVA